MTGVVLGIDPGAVETGLAVRLGDQCLAWSVVTRHADETGPHGVGIGPRYLGQIEAAARELHAEHSPRLVAVEGVKRPNPHVTKGRRNGNGFIDPTHTIAAGVVAGYLLGLFAGALLVPPGRHGSAPLAAYPAVLVTQRERAAGLNRVGDSGRTRHARSAYDVAGAGLYLARLLASKQA